MVKKLADTNILELLSEEDVVVIGEFGKEFDIIFDNKDNNLSDAIDRLVLFRKDGNVVVEKYEINFDDEVFVDDYGNLEVDINEFQRKVFVFHRVVWFEIK